MGAGVVDRGAEVVRIDQTRLAVVIRELIAEHVLPRRPGAGCAVDRVARDAPELVADVVERDDRIRQVGRGPALEDFGVDVRVDDADDGGHLRVLVAAELGAENIVIAVPVPQLVERAGAGLIADDRLVPRIVLGERVGPELVGGVPVREDVAFASERGHPEAVDHILGGHGELDGHVGGDDEDRLVRPRDPRLFRADRAVGIGERPGPLPGHHGDGLGPGLGDLHVHVDPEALEEHPGHHDQRRDGPDQLEGRVVADAALPGHTGTGAVPDHEVEHQPHQQGETEHRDPEDDHEQAVNRRRDRAAALLGGAPAGAEQPSGDRVVGEHRNCCGRDHSFNPGSIARPAARRGEARS